LFREGDCAPANEEGERERRKKEGEREREKERERKRQKKSAQNDCKVAAAIFSCSSHSSIEECQLVTRRINKFLLRVTAYS
jgi:hypothetical protein